MSLASQSMATTTITKRITGNTPNSDLKILSKAITSCLQTLNPQKLNFSLINPSLLTQFSPHLHPQLVIQVINTQTNPYHALFFFNFASNPDPNPNNYSHSNKCYVAITDLLLSHSLFNTASSLLHNSNKLSDFFISKFITAFGVRGNLKASIFWFHRAKSLFNGNCLCSYNAILSVCVKLSRIELARSFYGQIVSDFAVKPDVSTYTIIIRGFCKVGMVFDARKVFDEMGCEPNLITYNTMINGYCKKGYMDNALLLVHRIMQNPDCLPDIVTYSTLIDGYCKKGAFDEAMRWIREMEIRGCKPNLLTYNAVIYGLCLRGNVDEAKRMLTTMRLNGVKENLATHTSIIKGLCIAEKSAEVVEYFEEMLRKGMEPDEKVFRVVINALCKMRNLDEAISLLKKMKAKGIRPSIASFNEVLRALVELGKVDASIFLLNQMRQMGCSPNLCSYSIVIHGLCGAGGRMRELEDCVNKMQQNGLEIDVSIYSCLVEGYCGEGNTEMAIRVLYETIDKGYVIRKDSFLVLVKKFCEDGKPADAQKIFEDMCRRSSIVDMDCYGRILHEQLEQHHKVRLREKF